MAAQKPGSNDRGRFHPENRAPKTQTNCPLWDFAGTPSALRPDRDRHRGRRRTVVGRAILVCEEQDWRIQSPDVGPAGSDFHQPVAAALLQGPDDPGSRLEQVGKATGAEASLEEDDPADFEFCQLLDHEPQTILVVGWSHGDGDGDRRRVNPVLFTTDHRPLE